MEVVGRVFIADSYPLFVRGCKEILEGKGFSVTSVAQGAFASIVQTVMFDGVLLLDYHLIPHPVRDTLVSFIEQCSRVKLMLIVTDPNMIDVRDLVELGVVGFFVRTESARALVKAVSEVAGGGKYIQHPDLLAKLWQPIQPNPLAIFTRGERAVVNELILGRSVQAIADELVVAPQTVRNRLQSIYQKLGVHSRADVILWAWRQGLAYGSWGNEN